MKLGSGPARSSLHTLNVAFHRAMWDRRAISRAPQYLFQCGLATLVLLVVLIVEDAVLNAAVMVAVASTAFIVFVIPNSIAATPPKGHWWPHSCCPDWRFTDHNSALVFSEPNSGRK
jgi:hypothetical protein